MVMIFLFLLKNVACAMFKAFDFVFHVGLLYKLEKNAFWRSIITENQLYESQETEFFLWFD